MAGGGGEAMIELAMVAFSLPFASTANS
uniref:Uncharacterized protein n=1 Tax=Amphimedon queenslandica TaxID=400682 RepID=A0A1X7UDV0_AMPQE